MLSCDAEPILRVVRGRRHSDHFRIDWELLASQCCTFPPYKDHALYSERIFGSTGDMMIIRHPVLQRYDDRLVATCHTPVVCTGLNSPTRKAAGRVYK